MWLHFAQALNGRGPKAQSNVNFSFFREAKFIKWHTKEVVVLFKLMALSSPLNLRDPPLPALSVLLVCLLVIHVMG